jgi:hypothetical protein
MTEARQMRWSEFVRRKFHAQRKLEKALRGRLESGHSNDIDLDLDLYPFLSEWNSNPWTFSIYGSCSGTPAEHGRKGYGPTGGRIGNPNALFYAHSFAAHPMLPLFNAWTNFSSEGVVNKSKLHEGEGYEGIYLHIFEVNVPEEVIGSKNLTYLEKFWQTFKSEIADFRTACNAQSGHEHFERNLPTLERKFLKFIGKIGEPILFTTQDSQEYRAMLQDVYPYSSIEVCLIEGQMPRYFKLAGKEVNSIKRVESWLGEELFNSDWMSKQQEQSS